MTTKVPTRLPAGPHLMGPATPVAWVVIVAVLLLLLVIAALYLL